MIIDWTLINGRVMEDMILVLHKLKIIDYPTSCEYIGYGTICRCRSGHKPFNGVAPYYSGRK